MLEILIPGYDSRTFLTDLQADEARSIRDLIVRGAVTRVGFLGFDAHHPGLSDLFRSLAHLPGVGGVDFLFGPADIGSYPVLIVYPTREAIDRLMQLACRMPDLQANPDSEPAAFTRISGILDHADKVLAPHAIGSPTHLELLGRLLPALFHMTTGKQAGAEELAATVDSWFTNEGQHATPVAEGDGNMTVQEHQGPSRRRDRAFGDYGYGLGRHFSVSPTDRPPSRPTSRPPEPCSAATPLSSKPALQPMGLRITANDGFFNLVINGSGRPDRLGVLVYGFGAAHIPTGVLSAAEIKNYHREPDGLFDPDGHDVDVHWLPTVFDTVGLKAGHFQTCGEIRVVVRASFDAALGLAVSLAAHLLGIESLENDLTDWRISSEVGSIPTDLSQAGQLLAEGLDLSRQTSGGSNALQDPRTFTGRFEQFSLLWLQARLAPTEAQAALEGWLDTHRTAVA